MSSYMLYIQATVEVISEFNDDNVSYLELRTTPRANTVTNMSKEDYIKAVLSGIARCSERLPIDVRLLLSVDRRQQIADAAETVDLAIKYGKIMMYACSSIVFIS